MTIRHHKRNKLPIKGFLCKEPKYGAKVYSSHAFIIDGFRKYCKRCGFVAKEF